MAGDLGRTQVSGRREHADRSRNPKNPECLVVLAGTTSTVRGLLFVVDARGRR
jgi:hypothetical protein